MAGMHEPKRREYNSLKALKEEMEASNREILYAGEDKIHIEGYAENIYFKYRLTDTGHPLTFIVSEPECMDES